MAAPPSSGLPSFIKLCPLEWVFMRPRSRDHFVSIAALFALVAMTNAPAAFAGSVPTGNGGVSVDDNGPVTVRIASGDCRRLATYRPSPDVAYQPGVDAYGRPVASADLDPVPSLALPEDMPIEIKVNLANRFGIPRDPNQFHADALVGLALVGKDGRATLNGKPVTSDEQAALAAACAKTAPH